MCQEQDNSVVKILEGGTFTGEITTEGKIADESMRTSLAPPVFPLTRLQR